MTKIKIAVLDKNNEVKIGKNDYEDFTRKLEVEMEEDCFLATQDLTLENGDRIEVTLDTPDTYLMVKLDEAVDRTLVYVKDYKFTYHVTLTENQQNAQPDIKFKGKRHVFSARKAYDFEISNYQNLALNTHDQKEFGGAYPHAHANVETRNDATFFACNAIDGVTATNLHGEYPYQSWGINRQEDAALTIDFGRTVFLDKVAFTLRADYPHDSHWEEVTLAFSDGTKETFKTTNSPQTQFFDFEMREVNSVTFGELKKADDESPFPALIEIALFGKNK